MVKKEIYQLSEVVKFDREIIFLGHHIDCIKALISVADNSLKSKVKFHLRSLEFSRDRLNEYKESIG